MVLYPFKMMEQKLRYEKRLRELTDEVLSSVKEIVKGYVFYLVYEDGGWVSQKDIDSDLRKYGYVGDLGRMGLIVAAELVEEGKFRRRKEPELAYKIRVAQ